MPKLPKKKKFIDKNSATTYHLVHRSQKDPLQADEDAPQKVLVPSDPEHAAEQRKCGIDFDDDYDYLQHLKSPGDLNNVGPGTEVYRVPAKKEQEVTKKSHYELPAEVFPSQVENEVGLLNMAAPCSGPRLDFDPDILAALDDDYEHQDDIEDDFFAIADSEQMPEIAEGEEERAAQLMPEINGEANPWADFYAYRDSQAQAAANSDEELFEYDEQFEYEGQSECEWSDEVGSLKSFGAEETKTRFTNYSMTSSVVKRNSQLEQLDEAFEKVYEAEYGEDQIGDLSDEEEEGPMEDNDLMRSLIADFEKNQIKEKSRHAEYMKSKVKNLVPKKELSEKEEQDEEEEEEEEEETEIIRVCVPQDKEDRWDCETILSTYSNLYNHPKIIEAPSKKKNKAKKISVCEAAPEPEPERERPITYRPAGETLEEKKARKNAVKEEKRLRRQEKKEHKLAFKAESLKQKKASVANKRNKKL